MKPFDLDKARRETPGCNYVLHLNNAGAALMPNPVLEAISEHLFLEARMGGYEAAAQEEEKIANFYSLVAQLIHSKPSEVAYIENATRAWDMAFYGIKFQPGDKIITAEAEYASNYIAFLHVAKQTGVDIEVIPNDHFGQLSISELKNRIDARTKLIAITHIPTQGGLINPAEEVGVIAKEAGIFYLLDATQSVGQMPIDVQKIGCDALCATGRKFLRGPRGTGFLYVREQALNKLDPPFLDLHAAKWIAKNNYSVMPDARRFETWETNYSNKIGLAAAVKYALDWGLTQTWERIQKLSERLRKQLSSLPGITLQDLGQNKCGIVTFTSNQHDPTSLCMKLRARHINVSVSLQEYARLDLEARHLPSIVRSSVHYYNTEQEIDDFYHVLQRMHDG